MLCLYGFVGYINDPYVPFLPFLDKFHDIPGVFKTSMRAAFLISGTLLLFNVKVRTMALILGGSTLLVILSSKPVFRNHLFICGCFFLLAGLTHKKHRPWLLYVQFSLVYLGAVINKVPQLDWWTGQFMHNWLANARANEVYTAIAGCFPEMVFAKFLAWSSMLIELAIALMILNAKAHKAVVWSILIFHSLLYTLTAHRFGHFYEDIVLGLLIFMVWPKENLQLAFNETKIPYLRGYLRTLNFNRNFDFATTPLETGNWMALRLSNRFYTNWSALRRLLLYSSNFYFFLFCFDFFIRFLLNGLSMHLVQIVITWVALFFFLPMIWNDKKYGHVQ